MKKLLTVSVLAIMAVSAANADIASTGFVTDRTGTVTGAAFDSLTDAEKNLTGAINAIAGKVDGVNTQIEDAIGNAKVEDLSDGKDYAKTADVVTDAELAELTGTKDAAAGKVVTGVTTAGGVVTAVSESKITNDFIDDGTISQVKIDGLTTALDSKQGTIADLETIRDGAALGATSLQDDDVATSITEDEAQAGKLATSGLVANAIANSESNLSSELTNINETLEEIPNTYATITYVNNEDDKIEAVIGSGFTSTNTVASQLSAVKATADGAVQSVGAGAANGTISVDGTDVAVTGLGSAAYTASTDYATKAQGELADTALQKADITAGATNGTISVEGTDVAVTGLTAVASMELPTECEKGAATCALVYDPTVAGKLKWEAIMQ